MITVVERHRTGKAPCRGPVPRAWRAAIAVGLALWVGLDGPSGPAPALADPLRPLLVEGRSTVFQRVLSRGNATLHPAPGAAAERSFSPLRPLYVYAVEPGWYRVGPSPNAGPIGWMPAEAVVPWRQNIVGAFTNAVGRNRQILFETEERLRWLLEHEALLDLQPTIVTEAETGEQSSERGVVALEPAEHVDIRERFYTLPILDFVEDLHPLTYEPNLLLQVASVPLQAEPAPRSQPAQDPLEAGIVFVLDTTMSMDPFIEATSTAMQRIVRDLEPDDAGTRFSFGVLSFRDDVDAVPGIEYRTNLRLPLERRDDQSVVIEEIREAARVSTVSTPGFNEDSMAGIEDALELFDWDGRDGERPFDARVIVLVTDAGPKDPRDPFARSDISAAELQREAQDRNIAIMTLHLKTRAGGPAQHAYAEGHYRTLSRFHGSSYYYPIEGGSRDAFEATITRLIESLVAVIEGVREDAPDPPAPDLAPEIVDFGHALRLAYLGRVEGTQAPDLIRGWISERAAENPLALAIEPRLLVSKNELATMAEYLDALVQLGEQITSTEDAEQFFGQVREVIGRMAQNPDSLIATEAETLGGALEFLEDLPYRSQLLTITPEAWMQSAMRRRQILDGLRPKLVQYRKWLFDPEVWTALHEGAPDGEHVFALPFDALP